ncbi:hypothetical protein [Streptomyces sp. WMMC940]|uniref:hypothetical protein n=1 Tax=Streptomyces sp. WMMC940 TaxID=3015153 RepID=UPI0022B5F059|nr:hypothetical protein [Streptomyces sp. WMMC940]MCZ7459753.1 hypothetical protein [Streptomyces sp. WMMC940]
MTLEDGTDARLGVFLANSKIRRAKPGRDEGLNAKAEAAAAAAVAAARAAG